jgi:hypothetical protein
MDRQLSVGFQEGRYLVIVLSRSCPGRGVSIKGGPSGSTSAMVFPLRNSPGPNADDLRPSLAGKRGQASARDGLVAEPAGDRDLQRLEASVAWVRREALAIRADAGRRTSKSRIALPRAAQLPPVFGIIPVSAESSFRRRAPPTFQVAPPRACERLQLPLRRRRHGRNLRGALLILIAGTIVGSITYRVSVGGLLPASVLAQAALLQAQ